mgnify:FL=1
MPINFAMRIIGLLLLFALVSCDVQTITKEFFSNYFTDSDTGNWFIGGSGAPSSHKQYSCAGILLFGGTALVIAGYGLFTGDQLNPVYINRVYSTSVPHWSARIRATLYKIDSWNGESLFVTVDGITQKVYTWSSSFNSTDICGTPSPVLDSMNPSYSDGPVSLDINITHTAASLTLGFSTTLSSWVHSWGVRDVQIDLDYCDRSCSRCDGPSTCQVMQVHLAYSAIRQFPTRLRHSAVATIPVRVPVDSRKRIWLAPHHLA